MLSSPRFLTKEMVDDAKFVRYEAVDAAVAKFEE
jgi:hypothetical protein